MTNLEAIHEVKGRRFLFKVETEDEPGAYLKYEDLRNEIWEEPDDKMPGGRNMMCENFFHVGSSLFIGVYVEEEKGHFIEDRKHLIGFSYGFVGVKNKERGFRDSENLQFYSQYTGVKEDFYHFGLGVLIKEFQKEKLRDVFGIFTSTCTYDPLVGVNAYRNIHKLGMDVVEYKEAHYGEFGGKLNRLDIPCDRFYLSWDLRKEIHRPDYDLEALIDSNFCVIRSELIKIEGKKGPVDLEIVGDTNLSLDEEFLLVEIPYDFYLMLRETAGADDKVRHIPLEWRMVTRKAFQQLFQKGYKILDFRLFQKDKRKRDFYVLKR